jgi:hypothetical protein
MTMQVVFEASRDDLKTGLQRILELAEESAKVDVVDFNAIDTELELVTTGSQTIIDADIQSHGTARIPLKTAEKIMGILPTFPKRVKLSFEQGIAKINTNTIRSEHIEVTDLRLRRIDLPVNANVGDTLEQMVGAGPNTIAESGLTGRALEAHKQLTEAVKAAAEALAPLGISPAEVRMFVTKHVRDRARRARAGGSVE